MDTLWSQLAKSISLISILLAFNSCQYPITESEEREANRVFQPEYARFFKIEYFDSYKKIHLFNPWNNKSMDLEYYILADRQIEISDESNYHFIIEKAPKKLVALSSPMVGLLDLLDLDHLLYGVTDPELIYNKEILQRIQSKEIQSVGRSIQVNMEQLLVLQPDLIIGSGWDQMNADYEKMIQLKMTPVLMYDWQELHPLGKAEWMIALAAFFDEEEKAIQVFESVRDKYLEQKASLNSKEQALVFNGSEYQGIWYSAGGKSYMSQLYADAQADYLMKEDSTTGSLMLDFEVLMQKAAHADIWMYTGAMDSQSLALFSSPKYQSLSALKKHKVYSYHKRMNEFDANDYWETASFRPDIVLSDLIQIFHASEPKDLYYFKQVEY